MASRRARAVVRGLTGSEWDRVDDAELVVSELATNACRHGQGKVLMNVWWNGTDLRGEVTDDGPGFQPLTRARELSLESRGGWGLTLVNALTDAWGADQRPTRVWFQM